MWTWIVRIFDLLFGRAQQSATDQRLGAVQQERADLVAASQEDHRAVQIDEEVHDLSDDALNERLRKPPPRPDRAG